MKNTEYINTPAGIRRVRAIAKQINSSWGITMPQCMEMARAEVARWAFTFSPDGLRAQLAANGAKGGSVTSDAKTQAARANAKQPRPSRRKQAEPSLP